MQIILNRLSAIITGYQKILLQYSKGLRIRSTPDTKVIYAEGSDLAEGIHNLTPIPSRYLQTADGKQGALGEYYNNREMNRQSGVYKD